VSRRTIGEWFDEGNHALEEEVGWLLNKWYVREAHFVAPRMKREGLKVVREFGCRSGLLVRSLALLVPDMSYRGSEMSQKLLRMARERVADMRGVDIELHNACAEEKVDLAIAFSHFKHVPLETWVDAVCSVLRLGRFAAFDVQTLDHELDNGVDYPHVYATEAMVAQAVAAAGHEVVDREVWHEGTLPEHGTMRDVAFWTRSSSSAAGEEAPHLGPGGD
jgi:hypothetical protein